MLGDLSGADDVDTLIASIICTFLKCADCGCEATRRRLPLNKDPTRKPLPPLLHQPPTMIVELRRLAGCIGLDCSLLGVSSWPGPPLALLASSTLLASSSSSSRPGAGKDCVAVQQEQSCGQCRTHTSLHQPPRKQARYIRGTKACH